MVASCNAIRTLRAVELRPITAIRQWLRDLRHSTFSIGDSLFQLLYAGRIRRDLKVRESIKLCAALECAS